MEIYIDSDTREPIHPLVVSTRLYDLAGEHLHEPATAEFLLRKAIEVLETWPGDTNQRMWALVQGLAFVLRSYPDNLSKNTEGERMEEKAAALAEKATGKPREGSKKK